MMAQTPEQAKWIRSRSNLPAILDLQNQYLRMQTANKKKVQEFAIQNGIPITYEYRGAFAELQEILPDGTPIYYTTYNTQAGRATRTNHIQQGGSMGLNLMGQNMNAYIWDAGSARITHQEYNGRYFVGDSSSANHYHAAHVTGTIIASGVNGNAKGMAPAANAHGFDWNNDLSEATQYSNLGMLVSNHSYGLASFDANGNYALPNFYPGAYINSSRSWDQLMFNAPYYLMVVAAGNDGATPITNNPLAGNFGYDKLTGFATSKNSLVVANASSIQLDSNGKFLNATIHSTSSQGPTDDYRIKPDITGLGTNIYSTLENANNAYGSLTGTSMASPNVMGSLLLLQEHYANLNNGNFMRSATLKGLALHTADDAGPNGPDAVYGWGVLNAKKAAETISLRNLNSYIFELNMENNAPQTIHVTANGMEELRASISWTDKASSVTYNLNDPTPKLMTDLDIRVKKSGTTYFPWRLTGVTTNGKGDNLVDPFERVDIANPSGNYTIEITHKGSIPYGGQPYTLIVTGITAANCNASILSVDTGIACGGGSSPIYVQGNNSTTKLYMYDSYTGVTPIQTIDGNSGTFFTPEMTEDTTFYLAAGNQNCQSSKIPVHIMYVPGPSALSISQVTSPEEPISCHYDNVLLTAEGGLEESIIYQEDFSLGYYVHWKHSSPNNNIQFENVYENNAEGWSPEISLRYVSGSTTGNWYHYPFDNYEEELLAFDLSQHYNAKLSFRHKFEINSGSSNRNIYMEASTNGVNYTPVWSRTNIQNDITAEEVEVNLSAYDYAPKVYIRFRYSGQANAMKNWYMDDVILKGTKQNDITWSPLEGLYLDEARTIPYNGQATSSVFASPYSTLTYTASVGSSQSDCVLTASQAVQTNYSEFVAQSGNWSDIYNWSPSYLPSLNNCVRIPTGNILIVDTDDAVAKSIEIDAGGRLEITSGNSLVLKDEIINHGTFDDFILEHDANFVQLNNSAANSGQMKARKEFIFTDNINPNNDRKQYNFSISPVVDQNIKLIYPGNPSAIEFQEHNNYFVNSNGNYVPGKAFALREPSKAAVPSSTILAEFKGAPFNGEMQFNLKYTHNDNPDKGFNLVGNPYPSNVDLKLIYEKNKDNIEPHFYFWDNRGNEVFVQQGSNYSGDNYAYFNAVTGGGTGIAASGVMEDQRIPTKNASVGTGFMIRAQSHANNLPFLMDNSVRTTQMGPNFTGKGNNLFEEEVIDRYWLTLTTPNNLSSMIAIAYFEGGNNNFSLDDSETFGSSDDFYSLVDNHQLKIQGKSLFENTDTIKLGYRAFNLGTYSFSIFQKEGVFNDGQEIYLYDKTHRKTVNLQEGSYTFRTEAGEFNDRFEIIYKTKKIQTIRDGILVYKQNNNIEINSENQGIREIMVYDIFHKLVYQNSKVNKNTHIIPANRVKKEVYFIHILTEDGEWTTKKYLHR
jgi:hypothetical protein